jgi:starch synthase
VGGLAVSAALPRALREFADVRVIIPGYPAILRAVQDVRSVGRCQSFAAPPSFDVDLGHTADGLSYYVVRCPELYERDGTPYADICGADWGDNNVRFATFSYAAAQLARFEEALLQAQARTPQSIAVKIDLRHEGSPR